MATELLADLLAQLKTLSPADQQRFAADCARHVYPYYQQVFPTDHLLADALAEARYLGDRPLREADMAERLAALYTGIQASVHQQLDVMLDAWEESGGEVQLVDGFGAAAAAQAAALAFVRQDARLEWARTVCAGIVVGTVRALMTGASAQVLEGAQNAHGHMEGALALDGLPNHTALTPIQMRDCIEAGRSAGRLQELRWQLRIGMYNTAAEG